MRGGGFGCWWICYRVECGFNIYLLSKFLVGYNGMEGLETNGNKMQNGVQKVTGIVKNQIILNL
jgi:hypothetical protein